ncbi:unnamed protein product [Didymodactylos carnosus]|uniref:Uncharacterized protein n=1 Tax=Didymodactylos carnosus TaxID=1234261 RepID=A0A815HA33_9BILA|nr:unnamed protein product [Didymodactylos carnosus]CAF1348231.1 unnamed protein product [Didymodactylos carnosus]CAF4081133.1 unnamed protein product [Didymodactylos carnosus]CAF4215926.1 unnamed protein product [Didymodactylos carnosus]
MPRIPYTAPKKQPPTSFLSDNTTTVIQKTTANERAVSPTVTQTNVNVIPSKHKFSFNRPQWMTNKFLLIAVISASVIILLVIIIPIAVTFSRKGVSTTVTSTASTVISAYWSFDGNANDLYGNYSGSLVGSASYGSVGNTFFGTGQMFTMSSSNSYMQVPASLYFNLNSISFTFEAYIYLNSISGDQPIFGQCTSTTSTNQCLFLIVRSSKLYMGFNYNDLLGTTTLSASTWYHVAFVYNYQTFQQIIYIDGIQDAVRSSTTPYLGNNGSITIGYSLLITSQTYFYGYIDNVALTTRAKSATELLNDATQIWYFSFDQPSVYYDQGPNRLNSSNVVSLTSVSGKVNQGIRITTTSSYFQTLGYPYTGYPTNKPLTFAMWINPTSINSGILLHISSTQYGYSNQQELLGLTLSGQIVAQIYSYTPLNGYPAVIGPFISLNVWTHIAYTLSTTNGLTLYVNGVSQGSTGTITSYYLANTVMYITLGYSFGYQNNYIFYSTGFQGSFDEFYGYRRELSAAEIYSLANP